MKPRRLRIATQVLERPRRLILRDQVLGKLRKSQILKILSVMRDYESLRFGRQIKPSKKAFSYAIALAAIQGGDDEDDNAFTIPNTIPLESISVE